MRLCNRFVAVSKSINQLNNFVEYLDKLILRSYVGRDYKWAVEGNRNGTYDSTGDWYLYAGELYNCGQSEIEHWLYEDSRAIEFGDIMLFIKLDYRDYVEMSRVIAEKYIRVFDTDTGEVFVDAFELAKEISLSEIAKHFDIEINE